MQAVFAKILNMSITGSIVIAVVLLARLFLKRAPKIYSYALWAVVLFRLLCPLSITAGLSVLKPIPVTTTPGISAVSYTSYMFQVNAPFEDTPDAAGHYFAAFDFDAEGNFIAVYLQVNPVRDDAYTLTQSIVTTDPQVITTKLNGEMIRATK